MSSEALLALDTLLEMQRILYSEDGKRCPAMILRYYNQAWLHSMILRNLIIKEPKKLTLRKMFGVYFHNLSVHAGLMLRILSGQASNAESQERIFNSIKRITKNTSNYHPGQIIPNLLIRLQAEKEMGLQQDDPSRQQARISKLAQCLPSASNTSIPISYIKKHISHWQAHLQQIGDYLIQGEGVWWKITDGNVEFNDVTDCPGISCGPQLHHFRSSSLKNEEAYIELCWKRCIEREVVLPIHLIRLDQSDGTTKKVFTNYLGDQLPQQGLQSQPQLEVENLVRSNQTESGLGHGCVELEDVAEEDEDENVISISPVHISLETHNSTPDQPEPGSATSTSKPDHNQTLEKASYKYKTCLGKAVHVVLGDQHDVRHLDQMRQELKQIQNKRQKRNKILEERYEQRLYKIRELVSEEKTNLENKLKHWEKHFTISNENIEPSSAELQTIEQSSDIMKKLKYAKALLKEWDNNYH